MALPLGSRVEGWEKALAVGICEEIPGAMTQGETIDEVRENMKDAIALMKRPVILPEFAGQLPLRETVIV